ncbi:MAG: HAMP domain-containing sensor histidine kinase [Acidobacteriota bacterium]
MQPFLRRHPNAVFVVLVALPLALLLALQSWWLMKLQQAAVTADRATLTNYLDTVTADLVSDYGPSADRALRLSPELFTGDNLNRAADAFRRADFLGVRTFFALQLTSGQPQRLMFFDRDSGEMEVRAPSAETRAVIVACKPYEAFALKGIELDRSRLTVEERDPDHRIVLLPILGGDSRVVGVAGLILDEEYFRESRLPQLVRQSLPRFFPADMRENVVVRVTDSRGKTVFETVAAESGSDDVSHGLAFVFTDWRISAANRFSHPSKIARANLWVTLALSGAAAIVLVVGLGLAVRTTTRELRLSKMKSDFLANVSHELRTPLASIRVFAEFLRLGRVGDGQKIREYGTFIDAESRRLSKLVENLLDFSRIESGQKRYELQPMELLPVIDETLVSFRVRAQQSGTPLLYQPPELPALSANLDPEAFSQALFNLLDNALKYSPAGRPVELSIAREEKELVISVRDQGIGIPPEEHEKVFERFHRVGSSLVHDVKGSGLGLSIAKHIIEAHGGRLSLESTPGQGSTFRLHLPAIA